MVGPCTDQMGDLLNLAGLKHNQTVPLGLDISTKLSHHLTISLIPKGIIHICCYNLSSSLLKGSCSV